MDESSTYGADQPAQSEPSFTVAEIDAALLSLPEIERAVYLNHRKGGLSYRTIARRLGTTSNDVERIIASALLNLKRALDRIARERTR